MQWHANLKAAVVFDTNGYREAIIGKSRDDVIAEFTELRRREQSLGIAAMADPCVLLELLSHQADTADPAYDHCKLALTALYEHCRDDRIVRVLADPDSQLVKMLYGTELTKANRAADLGNLAAAIATARGDIVATSQGFLHDIKKSVQHREDQFVADMLWVVKEVDSAATSWRIFSADSKARKRLLKKLDQEDTLMELARVWVERAARLAGQTESPPSRTEKASRVLATFRPSLVLYREILKRLVMSGCDLTKRNRPNWIWDMAITQQIGEHRRPTVVLVTGDNAIVDAANEAGLGRLVVALSAYRKAILEGRSPI